MIDSEKALEQFKNLPVVAQLEFSHPNVINKLRQIEKKFAVNLNMAMIRVAIDDISYEEMVDYLMAEHNLDKPKAEEIKNILIAEILNPLLRRLKFIEPSPEKIDFGIDEEKRMILEILTGGLINELRNYPPLVECVNQRLFFVLSKDMAFKNEMEKALYENQEIISQKEFIIAGKRVKPMINVLLKDYIQTMGVEEYDNLYLTEYLAHSPNAKLLDEKEKQLVLKILKTFVNIKFFPESMPSDDGSDWQILPYDDIFAETVKKPLSVPKARTITTKRDEASEYSGKARDKMMTKEEMEKRQNQLKQEYFGPEEEVKKIQQEEINLETQSHGDLSIVRQSFLAALNQKNTEKTIAALRILIQKGDLQEECYNDEKISGLFKNYLKERYQPEVLADFQRNGFIAPYLSLFLQRVLKNQLGLSESQSARIGVQIENMLVRKGVKDIKGMVFGDLSKAEFVWQEIKDEGVGLVLQRTV